VKCVGRFLKGSLEVFPYGEREAAGSGHGGVVVRIAAGLEKRPQEMKWTGLAWFG
jgi:hypothetical protein